jgi:hypothetical protein
MTTPGLSDETRWTLRIGEELREGVSEHLLSRLRERTHGHLYFIRDNVAYSQRAACWTVRRAGVPIWCFTIQFRPAFSGWVAAVRENWPYLSNDQAQAGICFAVLFPMWIEQDMIRENDALLRLVRS